MVFLLSSLEKNVQCMEWVKREEGG